MDNKILEILLRRIGERLANIERALVDGSAADYAAYQNLVGQARGLAASQMEINDLLRNIKDSDNDD